MSRALILPEQTEHELASFTLPWPPVSTNQTWRHFRGVTILHPGIKAYRKNVAKTLLVGRIPTLQRIDPLDVTLKLYPPARSRCDVDNYAKVVLDSLTKAGFWRDDSCVKRLVQERMPNDLKPRIEVSVRGYRRSVDEVAKALENHGGRT